MFDITKFRWLGRYRQMPSFYESGITATTVSFVNRIIASSVGGGWLYNVALDIHKIMFFGHSRLWPRHPSQLQLSVHLRECSCGLFGLHAIQNGVPVHPEAGLPCLTVDQCIRLCLDYNVDEQAKAIKYRKGQMRCGLRTLSYR